MLPILLDSKFFKIYTFGVFLVLAFFWSLFILWKNVRLTSYKEEDIFDGVFVALTLGLFIGRLVHVATNFNTFGFDILKFLLINGYPGLSLYGCIAGVFLGLYLYLLSKKIRFQEGVDYFITPAFLALGIGKIGSFFSGVEIGAKTKLFLALKYAGHDGFRHLTAFYEGLLFFLGAFISYKLLFEIRRQKYPKGFLFYFFCWYFGLVYLLFDPLKTNQTFIYKQFSLNFLISSIMLLTFTLYFLYYFRALLLEKLKTITSLFFHYGQNAYGSIYSSARKKAKGRKSKDSSSD